MDIPVNNRIYFNIPNDNEEYATELGCQFDKNQNKWYCPDGISSKQNIIKCLSFWPGCSKFDNPYKIIDGIKILYEEIPPHERVKHML